MTEPLIHLDPPDILQPRPAHIPINRAVRWLSPYEKQNSRLKVSVFLSPPAFEQINIHAASDLENEVGGWLVGKWRVDKNSGRQFIVIENILPAPSTRHGRAYLTFTQETQVKLHGIFEQCCPDKDLVGWYHTHPRMGVFLSSYDMWLHQNFFPESHQVALVVEPHSSTGGFFIRQSNGTLSPEEYYGFYELRNRKQWGVVHWLNMYPEAQVNLRREP